MISLLYTGDTYTTCLLSTPFQPPYSVSRTSRAPSSIRSARDVPDLLSICARPGGVGPGLDGIAALASPSGGRVLILRVELLAAGQPPTLFFSEGDVLAVMPDMEVWRRMRVGGSLKRSAQEVDEQLLIQLTKARCIRHPTAVEIAAEISHHDRIDKKANASGAGPRGGPTVEGISYRPHGHGIARCVSSGYRLAAMLYIIQSDERPNGYVTLSESTQWTPWLARTIPGELDKEVRRRLISNLKHLLVGLEMKAALIAPHHDTGPGKRPVLFEPYYQNLILEFCVAAFSVVEGLGSAHWLAGEGVDGADGPTIRRNQWKPALLAIYDPDGRSGLDGDVERTLTVRDRLHQDKLGARDDIDWHAFSYDAAFAPAASAIRTLLRREAESVPATSNLHRDILT